jgi:hypothetical protein
MVDQNLHCSFVAVARGLHKGCLAIAACYAPQTIPVRTNECRSQLMAGDSTCPDSARGLIKSLENRF